MAITITPSVGGTISAATTAAQNEAGAKGGSFIISGLSFSAGAGLVLNMAAGSALVNGYFFSSSAQITATLTDATTNYLWLEPDGTLTDNTTGTNPGDALYLGTVSTSGGSISIIRPIRSLTNGPIVYVRKLLAQDIASSTVLTSDTELTASIGAGIWQVTFNLKTTYGATGGIRVAITTPSTYDDINLFVMFGQGISSDNAKGIFARATGVASGSGSAVSNGIVYMQGIVSTAVAGTLAMQFSQSSSNATNTTIESGSTMTLVKLS